MADQSTTKRGGARKGAGRPKGVPNKINRLLDEKRAAIIEAGGDPVDFLIEVMKNAGLELGVRIRAAEYAAPYIRPQLKSIQHTGKDGGAIEIQVNDKDRAKALMAFIAKTKAKKNGDRD